MTQGGLGVSDLPVRQWSVGDHVEVDVPEVEGIGAAYTTRGFVISAQPGHQVVIECDDRLTHWRLPSEIRAAS